MAFESGQITALLAEYAVTADGMRWPDTVPYALT